MNAFTYHRPSSGDEAAALLGADVRPLAGGMTILPTIKQRLASPSGLVDLSGIGGLDAIDVSGGAVTVGAMARHAQVASSDAVKGAIPALAQLASGIGDAQVRHRGTIGGSIANNDPAADYPAALLALNAAVHTNKRELPASEFFTGLFSTALADDEIVLKVVFPVPEKAAYVKFRQPASLYALVGVFVAKDADGVRAAVTGAGLDGVFRSKEVESVLEKDFSAAGAPQVPADGLASDLHGTSEYRAHLVAVLALRAAAAC